MLGFALALLLFSIQASAENPVEAFVRVQGAESAVPALKKGNGARVLLSSRSLKPSPLAFLYLHGFSASPRESSPLVERLAESRLANAYFPRYRGHGIEGPEGLRGVKLADWEKETREALHTARSLGDRVVVVAMSNGAALVLPALLENPDRVAALVMISPSFRLHRFDSLLLLLPWGIGARIARIAFGEYREWEAKNEEHKFYWTTRYPSEILTEPVLAAARAKAAELEKLKIPVLMIYSPADQVVHVPSMIEAFERIGAEKKEKFEVLEPELDAHVLAGNILSPKNTALLEKKISEFLGGLGI